MFCLFLLKIYFMKESRGKAGKKNSAMFLTAAEKNQLSWAIQLSNSCVNLWFLKFFDLGERCGKRFCTEIYDGLNLFRHFIVLKAEGGHLIM